MLFECVIETYALLDIRAHGIYCFLHLWIFRLSFQHLQYGQHRHTGPDHGAKLLCEKDQVPRFDLGKLLLDP